ncbi:hypothetical protein IF1G_01894 [Cordyceps javanica]|uniref:Uncharacterized protein n=1 Tax=Cordyceps javanica TaxID=43265 RepID=A0A545VDI1_9HYPO|nr:hypothetical protein IF1G_01894 [Cordyceps javanica]
MYAGPGRRCRPVTDNTGALSTRREQKTLGQGYTQYFVGPAESAITDRPATYCVATMSQPCRNTKSSGLHGKTGMRNIVREWLHPCPLVWCAAAAEGATISTKLTTGNLPFSDAGVPLRHRDST